MIEIRLLIMTHFEIGDLAGDYPGEAQFFYEEYLTGSTEYKTANGWPLYVNEAAGVALSVTGEGKVNSACCLTGILTDPRFDFSRAYIMGAGCAGGCAGRTIIGDVIIETGICDSDLGHKADIRDMRNPEAGGLWYHVDFAGEPGKKVPGQALAQGAYELTRNLELETTEQTREALLRNFPGEAWADREPVVLKGTMMSGDNYWKGKHTHDMALQIAEYYKFPDPLAGTDMEDVAMAYVAEQFHMLDRFIGIRVVCNEDIFLDDDCPENLWGGGVSFNDNITTDNSETVDAFVPCMRNLFRAGKIIADGILKGYLQ